MRSIAEREGFRMGNGQSRGKQKRIAIRIEGPQGGWGFLEAVDSRGEYGV
jgi:hypothetical protein